jgi:cupin-like protein
MATALAASTRPAASAFDCNGPEFREQFNRRSFEFGHHLAGHRLFGIPRLIELSKRLSNKPGGNLYYDAGEVRVNQRWDESPTTDLSVDETIRRIEEAGAWVVLKRSEQDPEYRALLNECMAEIQTLLGRDLKREMKGDEVIIFITSPNRITTYHIDRECNFLLQMHGEKDISVFDQNDRQVLPEQEIERFWTVDNNAAIYKEQYQSRAKVYHLAPGKAIHIPVNAPHWVKNGNNISVSLSVNFQFRETFPANVYRANFLLRKLGINPVPPGQSRVRDAIKGFAMNSTYLPAERMRHLVPSKVRRLIRRIPA